MSRDTRVGSVPLGRISVDKEDELQGIYSIKIHGEKVPFDEAIKEAGSLKKLLIGTKSVMDKVSVDEKRKLVNIMRDADLYRDLNRLIAIADNAQAVTNAWRKYRELLSWVDARTDIPTKFTAFANAELPGAGICSLVHYMADTDREVEWYASSLTPTQKGGALGDTYGIYRRNKDKWVMGDRPGSGDMTSMREIERISSIVLKNTQGEGVYLYSHDAGMDVDEDPNNQESINFTLHLGCALCGLMCLKEGGVFIAKQYTILEEKSIALLAVYASLFERFHIVKPPSSRPLNSEVYLVGIGYKRRSSLKTVEKVKAVMEGAPFNISSIPKTIVEHNRAAVDRQVLALKGVYAMAGIAMAGIAVTGIAMAGIGNEKCDRKVTQGEGIKLLAQTRWLTQYPIKRLESEKWVPSDLTPLSIEETAGNYWQLA